MNAITASEPLLRRVVTSLGLEGAETLAMMLIGACLSDFGINE